MNRCIFIVACSAIFWLACKNELRSPSIIAGPAFQIDTLPGDCPYLVRDNKGNTVMSWARKINDSTSVFCYAVTNREANPDGKIITIPFTDNLQPHAENLPKIIFKPSGEIIALWGVANPGTKNKYAGLVFYSQSFDEGKKWSEPKRLVSDTAGYDQRYYDVALLPGGEAAIIWLDNRKTTDQEGSALYFAATDGINGFQKEKMVTQGCCQCCRTDLFIDSKAGIHILYRGIIKDSIRDMLHSVSTDGGKTFSDPRLISQDNWVIKGCPHTGPAMTENNEGIHFAWFTGGRNKGCYYTTSADNGKKFARQDMISSKGSHPQISTLPGGRLIIAWDEPHLEKKAATKHIGIQVRIATGETLSTTYLHSANAVNGYPVLAATGENRFQIAYTEERNGKNYVMIRDIRAE